MNEKSWKQYLQQLKDNEEIWVKKDSETTQLRFWKNPFICETKGCGKETHLTSNGPAGFHHPICEECYKELHAYHVAVVPKLERDKGVVHG